MDAMSTVVVTSWDPASRTLTWVPVNGGDGGGVHVTTVSEQDAVEVAAQCASAVLPRVGELVDEDDGCLLELTGPDARWCRATWHKKAVRLSDLVTRIPQAALTPHQLGLPDADTVQQVDKIDRYLLVDPDGPLIGCWVHEGGLTGWLADKLAERERRKAEKEAKRERQRVERETAERRERDERRFVNPYTFMPFPATISRCRPAGHHLLAPGRFSGRFEIRWEFTSPMQAPEEAVDGDRLRLPGSSVKGAVRSVHETLAGGCLRVLDEEFVPSYRDPVITPIEDWTLAVVTEVTADGQPLAVRLASQVVWVHSDQLMKAWDGELRTGCRVDLDPPHQLDSLGRYVLATDARVVRDGDWTVLLADAGARRETRKDGTPAQYFAACGRITDADPVCEVDDAAWRVFRQAVAGAREAVESRSGGKKSAGTRSAGKAPPAWVDVEFPKGHRIGQRRRATGRFEKDDILWVCRSDGDRVDALKLSVLWRHPGAGSLGERVPPYLRACAELDKDLCPSCRLFGSADTRPRDPNGTAQQHSYAGHVRFGDAVSESGVALEAFRRVPLGAPRPGAGQFYLSCQDTRPAVKKAGKEEPLPTREWGARPDAGSGGLRPVRGRKFYWHADPRQQEPIPRHKARPHHEKREARPRPGQQDRTDQKPRMIADRLLAPPGTVLVQTVTFDNLDLAELGGLLATLEPARVLAAHAAHPDQPLRLHLGGGKPLGLGSCTATVENLRTWTAASRYGSATAEARNTDAAGGAPDTDAAVDAFVASCPSDVAATWPAVAAVLADGTVDARRVWYPPGLDWPDQPRDTEEFDKPFHFFTATSGRALTEGEPCPLLPLPEPTAADQSLPIIRKGDVKRRPEERRR